MSSSSKDALDGRLSAVLDDERPTLQRLGLLAAGAGRVARLLDAGELADGGTVGGDDLAAIQTKEAATA